MSFDLALIVAIFIIVASILALAAIFSARRQKAKDEELQRAASARGWKFESKLEKGYRVHRWTGTTDGIAWTAESLRHTAGGNKRDRRRHIARWHGAYSPGISGPIVAMGVPKGKETIGEGIVAEGWIARLAQKAVGFAFDKAIDVHFGQDIGKHVDAGAMQRVGALKAPGFIFMAANKDEGARILSQGFEKAVVDASNDRGSVLSHDDRPWILLRPTGISLARMERYRDINELDAFVRAGVGLTRAFTFGRRSPS